jgi:hypothetical protein
MLCAAGTIFASLQTLPIGVSLHPIAIESFAGKPY